MIFLPKISSKWSFPNFYLDGKKLSVANRLKYLGVIIRNDCNDSIVSRCNDFNINNCKESSEIGRMMRSVYSKGNIIINKYFMCSETVKVKLFKSYCTNFYGLTVLSNFNNESYRKLSVSYKRIFRSLFMFKMRPQGTSQNMLRLGIDPLPVIERKLLQGFYTRLSNSTNCLIKSILSIMSVDNSPFLKRYHNQVYMN